MFKRKHPSPNWFGTQALSVLHQPGGFGRSAVFFFAGDSRCVFALALLY